MNRSTYSSTTWLLALIATMAAAIVWSCDSFDPDVTAQDKVSLEQNQFYTLSNSSTVIDLKSVVKSSGKVDLLIDQQPGHGSLTRLGAGLYAYMPAADFKGGRDYFTLDIRQDGKSLATESIYLEVGQDTTQLPCGVYALMDRVVIPDTAALQVVTIDVLANDHICGTDSSDLEVSVFSTPRHGSVAVSGNRILYTTSGYAGYDQFLYEVRSVADTSVHSLGLVSLILGDTCRLVARPDSVNVSANSQGFGVNIFVLDNDSYCDSIPALSIVTGQHFGTVTVDQEAGTLFYKPDNSTYAPVDSLQYRICRSSGACSSAWVRITSF